MVKHLVENVDNMNQKIENFSREMESNRNARSVKYDSRDEEFLC